MQKTELIVPLRAIRDSHDHAVGAKALSLAGMNRIGLSVPAGSCVAAAAIVMDQGGLLSHGSIITREYGIPAVVNVGPATKIIKTGKTIQVDGDRGVVRMLP